MPDRLHEDDVDQQGPQRLGVFHHRAAELDDREPAVELADVAQRLDQDIRLADRFLMHVESPSRSGLLPDDQTAIVSIRADACKVATAGDSSPIPWTRPAAFR